MKQKFIVIIALVLLLTTGCTKYVEGEDNKKVMNPATDQALVSNILCLPEDPKLVEIYENNLDNLDVEWDKLKPCSEFKINYLKYESLWTSIFVNPLAFIILKLGSLVKSYGLSIMIIGILIRLVLLPFSIKMKKQSEKMKLMQPEMQKIEEKFKNKNDEESLRKKQEEMMMMYQKYNINPIGSCLLSFIQLPLFFAFLEAINRLPAIFEESFLSLQMGTSPLRGITDGNYLYILVLVLIIVTTYFSFKTTMNTGGTEQKQMKMMTNIMMVFIVIVSFSLPTAIALYWISTNLFAIVQNKL